MKILILIVLVAIIIFFWNRRIDTRLKKWREALQVGQYVIFFIDEDRIMGKVKYVNLEEYYILIGFDGIIHTRSLSEVYKPIFQQMDRKPEPHPDPGLNHRCNNSNTMSDKKKSDSRKAKRQAKREAMRKDYPNLFKEMDSPGNLGIDKLKVTALILIDFGMELEEKLSDKKLTLKEIIGFADNIFDIRFIVENGREIRDQFMDLTIIERRELVDYVCSELLLTNVKAERMIEYAFNLILAITAFLNACGSANEELQA